MMFANCAPDDQIGRRHGPGALSGHITSKRDKLLMAIACAVGSVGLAVFACHVARINQAHERHLHPNAITVNRFEAIRLWVPPALIDLAERGTVPVPPRSHEELRQVLEGEQLRELWYAVTVREHHENGGFNDLTVIRWPYNDRRHFPEFPEVLAAATGNPRPDPTVDLSLASICVVPGDFRARTPREVLGEALGHDVK